MKKSRIFAMLTAVALFLLLAACSSAGDVVFEIESVEQNDLGFTKESFAKYQFVLNDDGTYAVNFRATGMPVTISEKGTYEIKNGTLVLTCTSDRQLVDEVLDYNSRTGIIRASCRDRDSDGVYVVVFKKSDSVDYSDYAGSYGLKTVSPTGTEFSKFSISIDEDGGYIIDFKKDSDIKIEDGTLRIGADGKITLSKENGNSVGLTDIVLTNNQITAKFLFNSTTLTLTFEKGYIAEGGDVSQYVGTYALPNANGTFASATLILNSDKTYTFTAVAAAGPQAGNSLTEEGTFEIFEGSITFSKKSGTSLIKAGSEMTITTTTVTIEPVMGANSTLNKQ